MQRRWLIAAWVGAALTACSGPSEPNAEAADVAPVADAEARDSSTAPDAVVSSDARPERDAAPLSDATPLADATLPVQDAAPPVPDAAPLEDAAPREDASAPCESDLDFFERAIAPRIVSTDFTAPACKLCHVPEGPAFASRLVFAGAASPDAADLATLEAFVTANADAPALLVDKPSGRAPHGGGQRFAPDSPDEGNFRALIARILEPGDGACAAPPVADAASPEPDAAIADAAPPEPDAAIADAAPPTPDASACVTDRDFVRNTLGPLVDAPNPAAPACALCHTQGGIAGGTRLVLERFGSPDADARNFEVLRALVQDTPDGARLLIEKPTAAVPHGGGRRFAPESASAAVFREVIARLASPADACDAASADAGVGPPEPPPVDLCRLAGPHAGAAPLRRLTDSQYANTVRDVLGVEPDLADLPTSPAGESFHTFAVNNVMSSPGVESLMLAAESVAGDVDLAQRLRCVQGETEASCVRRFLSATADALFRRPLEPAEAALVAALAETGLPADEAARFGLEVLLQSPQFLYLDPDAVGLAPGESRVSSPATVAARLAYFLTNAPPSPGLRALAAAGGLTERAEVHAAAAAMLDARGVSEMVARFHRDWLHLGLLDRVAKDPERFPLWGPELIDQLKTEVDLFTTEIVWNGDARFSTLMSDTRSWLTPDLGALYGVAVDGPGFTRVDLGPDRPGVLTRAAFLAAHAYAATSSPVRRGAFVLKQMLCESLSPPPGVNMALPEGPGAPQSVRERLVQHWTDPSCSTCHLRIDPIGLGFEAFGAVGELREAYPNGDLVDPAGVVDDPAIVFSDAADLIEGLAEEPRVQACYVRRWYEYAIGRTAAAEDACTLALLTRRFEATGGDIRSLLVDIAATDAFLYVTTSPDAEVAP